MDHNLQQHHNNYVQHNTQMNSPNAMNINSGDSNRLNTSQGNNIFVPGSMRFANMNR